MKRKLMCIGIISMFILVGFSSVTAIYSKEILNDITGDDEDGLNFWIGEVTFEPNPIITMAYNKPPVIDYFIGPTSLETGEEGEFKVYVSDQDGDNIWLYINWESIAPWDVEWIGPYNSNEEITLYHTWDNSFYDWILQIGVKAKDINGDESEEIHHRIVIGNDRPIDPYIDGPSYGRVEENIEFNVEADDFDGDFVYFFIEWGDYTNTGWIGPYSSCDVPSTVVEHAWDGEGAYIIKVKVKDEHGLEGLGWGYHNIVISDKGKIISNKIFINLLEKINFFYLFLKN